MQDCQAVNCLDARSEGVADCVCRLKNLTGDFVDIFRWVAGLLAHLLFVGISDRQENREDLCLMAFHR